MSKIKIFVLFFTLLTSYTIEANPGYEFDSGELELDNSSPRKKALCQLIAPLIRRHSIGTYVASFPIPPTPPMPIQPPLKSPAIARRSRSAQPE